MQRQAQDYNCPVCGNTNRVHKVSVVYERGSSFTVGSSEQGAKPTNRVEAMTMTLEAQKLAPPSSLLGFLIGCALFLLVILIAVKVLAPLLYFIVTTILVIAILLFFFYVLKIDVQKLLKRRALWEQLYYCDLHNLVFLPGQQQATAIEASRMKEIYSR
jgi:hypothetical protein